MWYKPAPMHSADEQRATRESTHIQCGTSQHRCTLQRSSGPHGSPHTFDVVQASTDALCRGVADHTGVSVSCAQTEGGHVAVPALFAAPPVFTLVWLLPESHTVQVEEIATLANRVATSNHCALYVFGTS